MFPRSLFGWFGLLALACVSELPAEQVVFSKIMYGPVAGHPQYLEVCNNTVTPFDIARWRLTGGVQYEFPDFSTNAPKLTFLKPFERILLCGTNASALRVAYGIPESVRIYGPWTGRLNPQGERLTLKDQNGVALCAVKYGARAPWPSVAEGSGQALVIRDADQGVDDWRNWAAREQTGTIPGVAPSGASTNLTLRLNEPERPAGSPDIVINEIMYDPPSTLLKPVAYIELFNRGAREVDLSRWEFVEGIQFRFPPGARIGPGEFLVVTANTNRLRAAYGNIPMLGNWEGKLLHHGERVRLVDAHGALVNQVDFRSGGHWPELAAGGGSSLELINPWLDSSFASAWCASDEAGKSVLREYSSVGKYEELHSKGGPSDYLELHLHLVGEGHLVLRDIFFGKTNSNQNYIRNGDKLSDDGASAQGWLCQGTHWASYLTNGEFHLISEGHGDNRANRVEIDLPGLKKGDVCELRFQARWISGKPRLIAQTWDHSVADSILIEIPANLGTPGAPNSRFQAAPPPQVDALTHFPAVPRSTNRVTVSARISGPVPLEAVRVFYRADDAQGNHAWLSTLMAAATPTSNAPVGGLFSAELPARPSGRVVQFYVQATATNGQTRVSPPDGPRRPALYVVDDRKMPHDLRTVRLVVSAYDIGSSADGNSPRYQFKHPRPSNHSYNSTFIVGERDPVYQGEVRQGGSPWTRGGTFDRPKVKWPRDHLFRSHEHYSYDNDAAGGNFHNRITRYWLYLMGLPANESEVVRLYINADEMGLREETEPVGNDFLNRNFPRGSRGLLYRVDDEWWFTDSWDRDNRDADWSYKGSDNPGRYRTEYMLRTQEVDDNYADLIAFFKLVSSEKYTQEQIEEYLDPQAVLKYIAVRGYTSDWDTFTTSRGKNVYFYERPEDGKFMFLQWDSDLAFGDPNAGFYGWRVENWVQRPYNRRLFHEYLAVLHDQLAQNNARFKAWLQADEEASEAYSPNPGFYLDFCARRGNAVASELGNDLKAVFMIKPFTPATGTTNETILLSGTAPCTVRSVRLAQQPEARPHWKDTVTWQFPRVPLRLGSNPLTVQGLNGAGRVMEQIETSIVRVSAAPNPSQGPK